ncbi:unnamed protein product [Ixodes pacificus]
MHTRRHTCLRKGLIPKTRREKKYSLDAGKMEGVSFFLQKPQHTAPSRTRFVAPAAAEIKEAETRQSPYDGIGDMTLSRQHCRDEKKKKKTRLSTPRANLALSSFPSSSQDNTPPVAGRALFQTKEMKRVSDVFTGGARSHRHCPNQTPQSAGHKRDNGSTK